MTHEIKKWALGLLARLLRGVLDRPAGGSNRTLSICVSYTVVQNDPPEPPPSSVLQGESVVPGEPSGSIGLPVPKAGNPTRNEPPLTSDAVEEGGDARVPRFNREAPGWSAGSVPECSPRATPHRDPITRQPLHRTHFEPRCREPRSWDGETNYGMHKEERK